jgi:rhodanese-related sulfurtransferase
VTVDDLLARARSRLRRVEPSELAAELERGAVLVDIRSDMQRSAGRSLPGAVEIPRNVLEWRCDPSSEWRDPRVSDSSRRVILMCEEGYQSSLAAAVLQDLGHPDATDLVGGFQALRAAGLPPAL